MFTNIRERQLKGFVLLYLTTDVFIMYITLGYVFLLCEAKR